MSYYRRDRTESEARKSKEKAAMVLEHQSGVVEQVLTDAVSASSLSKK